MTDITMSYKNRDPGGSDPDHKKRNSGVNWLQTLPTNDTPDPLTKVPMNIPVINLDIFNNWIQLEEPEAETPERERAIQECKRVRLFKIR